MPKKRDTVMMYAWIIVSCLSFLIGAMAPEQPVNTYFGTEITPQSIGKMVHLVPPSLSQKITTWQLEHGYIISELLRHPTKDELMVDLDDKNQKLLKNNNIKILGYGNYVFELPTDTNYVVKIESHERRLKFIRWYRDRHKSWDYNLPLYNTASQAAFYLRFKELAGMVPLRHILVPETYLLTTSGDYTDADAIIVQEKLDLSDCMQVYEMNTHGQLDQIPHQAWHDLMHVFRYVPLPDLEFNLHYNQKSKQFVIFDLEDFYQFADTFYNKKRSDYLEKVRYTFSYLLMLSTKQIYLPIHKCIKHYISHHVHPSSIDMCDIKRFSKNSS